MGTILPSIFEGNGALDLVFAKIDVISINCVAAVVLNVLIVAAISHTTAVVFMLGGVIKDIFTILASMVLFGSPVGVNQVIGFSMSLTGILMYKTYKQNLEVFMKHGFVAGFHISLCNSGMEPPKKSNV